jgi:PEP-CTERM motif
MTKRNILGCMVQMAALACISTSAHAANYVFTEGAPPVVISDPAGSGQAASLYLVDSSDSLVFSNGGIPAQGLLGNEEIPISLNGAVMAFNTLGASLSTLEGSTQVERQTNLVTWRTHRTWMEVRGAVPSVAIDSATGQVGRIAHQGAFELAAPYRVDVADGGILRVSNLVSVPTTGQVYADISYRQRHNVLNEDGSLVSSELGEWRGVRGVHLWSAQTVSGTTTMKPLSLSAAADGDPTLAMQDGFDVEAITVRNTMYDRDSTYYALTADFSFRGLLLTQQGLDIMQDALGLGSAGWIGYEVFRGINAKDGGWGDLRASVTMVPTEAWVTPPFDIHQAWGAHIAALPEPSTYALMGLGLLGVVTVSRRRRQTAA